MLDLTPMMRTLMWYRVSSMLLMVRVHTYMPALHPHKPCIRACRTRRFQGSSACSTSPVHTHTPKQTRMRARTRVQAFIEQLCRGTPKRSWGGAGREKERAARDRAGPRPQCESARRKSPWPTSSAAKAAQGSGF
jgi:hypothetical protein